MSTADAPPTAPQAARRLPRAEFIAMMGTIFATVAFSIDAMLPALPQIEAALTPDAPNLAQLVLTSFVLGLGIGTLFTGPLSDSFGRKPVILAGAGLYIIGALLAWIAPSLELLLAARVLQGLGAAGPRVVATAIIRDLYAGRQMAQIVSFAMLIFTIFPAVAPMIGAGIIWGFGWRAIFIAFLLFSLVSVGWLTLRQPETLPPAVRRDFRLAPLRAALKETLALRQMQLSILVQTLVFGALFGTISSIQPIFDDTYGRAASFPYWFALIAAVAAPAAPINGALVIELGMRPLVRRALFASLLAAGLVAALIGFAPLGAAEFWVFFAWACTVFALAGFTIGNLNALALEPLGHIAGMAASIMGALATVGGAAVGALIGQFFDGTPMPLILSTATLSGIGAVIMFYMPREPA
jgi:DHA1 family bicyclomycin/chloramphenicol resistance-like MFS transporter